MSDITRAMIVGVSLAGTMFILGSISYVVTYIIDASRSAENAHERITKLRDDLYELQKRMERGEK